MTQVADFMNRRTVSVSLTMSVMDVNKIFIKNNLKGAAVIDANNIVYGVIKYDDFITKDTNLHLPTFLRLFEKFGLNHKDKKLINKDLAMLTSLQVKDIITYDAPVVDMTADIKEAAKIFFDRPDIDLIPVVNRANLLEGTITRNDLIKLLYADEVLSPKFPESEARRPIDKKVDTFLTALMDHFVFISKNRMRRWIAYGIICMILGFFIANFLLINISV